jgi:hypothetical protein
MARHVFFSFHHGRDVWRAGQVRNSWMTRLDAAGFWDSVEWESVKKKDPAVIERWIDVQMVGTSVTVVLIGAQTSQRRHVRYEIKESHLKGNGMLGIYIHRMKHSTGATDTKGENPFGAWQIEQDGRKLSLAQVYPTYDWVMDDGRSNMGKWIEEAARRAGR